MVAGVVQVNSALVSTLRSVPWLIAVGALVLTLQALLGQVALQSQIIKAMQGVHGNLREAVWLTRGTSVALEPLVATTETLERINARLYGTNKELNEVNTILDHMVGQQQGIRGTLFGLTGRSRYIVTALKEIDQTNWDLLTVTGAVALQTESQASVLERLRILTSQSIGQLRMLNQKLAFLAR